MAFQMMRAGSAPRITLGSTMLCSMMPPLTAFRDRDATGEQRGEVEEGRPHYGGEGAENACSHDGGDGIRRIVEPVAEIEHEGDRDDRDDVPDHWDQLRSS